VDVDEEYSAFVAARWPALVRSAVLLGCSANEAEDLVQSTLVKCYVSWDKVAKASNQDGYVYRIMLNTHRSNHRRSWREQPSDRLPESVPTDSSEAFGLADTVRGALSGLSLDSRAVVVLRFFADFTDQQTADVLAIPVGTVKSRLSRALSRLAQDPQLSDIIGRSRP
jgi:RNA polymerase sigma-70 factor (sigma-E family)